MQNGTTAGDLELNDREQEAMRMLVGLLRTTKELWPDIFLLVCETVQDMYPDVDLDKLGRLLHMIGGTKHPPRRSTAQVRKEEK